jgi:polyphosphate kinase 2 (PPK2 family)
MLEKIVAEDEIEKPAYTARLAELEYALFELERRAREAGIPSIVLFEGLAAAGKGAIIRTLTERLDPRGVKVHPIHAPRWGELERPWLWRFWMRLPNRGEIAIFDTSWYRHVIDDRVRKEAKRREVEERFHEINELERMLVADGHVLVKIWLHVGRKEQAKRLRKAEKDKEDFWDVTEEEREQNEHYKDWVKAAEEALERTGTEWAPWTIVDTSGPRRSRLKVFEAIVAALRERLAKVKPELAEIPPPPPRGGGSRPPAGARKAKPRPARAGARRRRLG